MTVTRSKDPPFAEVKDVFESLLGGLSRMPQEWHLILRSGLKMSVSQMWLAPPACLCWLSASGQKQPESSLELSDFLVGPFPGY